jgi:hypothetical protein
MVRKLSRSPDLEKELLFSPVLIPAIMNTLCKPVTTGTISPSEWTAVFSTNKVSHTFQIRNVDKAAIGLPILKTENSKHTLFHKIWNTYFIHYLTKMH